MMLRNNIDHLSAVINIIKKLKKLSAYTAVIDFYVRYTIDRNTLFNKIRNININDMFMSAINSLYHNVQSCVRVNGQHTGCFDVKVGFLDVLRQ